MRVLWSRPSLPHELPVSTLWLIHCLCLVSTALPLQSDSIQSLSKDPLTPDDSAVTDLSPKTDSGFLTETPTRTDVSSKTDGRPSTPGSSPLPKKGTVPVRLRHNTVKTIGRFIHESVTSTYYNAVLFWNSRTASVFFLVHARKCKENVSKLSF